MIEATCVIPDGDHREEVYRLTNEMYRFLLHFYRLNPETRRFVYDRGGLLIRPQKWGKGPFAAAQTCAEARGPVLFDHWAEKGETDPWGFEFEKGEPVGRPWATPKIEITASSEDQAGNVWDVLLPMIELGSLKAEIPDTGVTRINLIGGGEIVPVTASPRSRLGQRVTFVVQDETHSWWKSNGGHLVADNQRRNVSGMKGRFLETTNAWDPIEESVAQATNANPIGVYVDDVDPGPGSVRNKKDRYKMYPRVYGDSWWIDFDRIDSEVQALIAKGEAQQAERFFLNRKIAQEGAAFEPDKWKRLVDATVVVPDQSLIVLGVNGSRSSSLAIVGTEVESGHQFVVGLWELPKGAEEGFEHPVHEIDGAMLETFDKYEVWRAYTYGNIATLAATWEGRWDKKIIDFPINSPTRMAVAVRNYVGAVNGGEFTTDGNSTMAAHIRHARKKRSTAKDPEDGRPMWTLAPDRPNSPRSIAGAIAGVLSWEARGDAIAAGATQTSDAVSGSF
jgi:hypothetical protein